MRKVLFSLLVISGLALFANKTSAQTAPLKIGYFDMDQMVQAMPEYKTVIQPKIEAFQRDSLGPQRDNIELQYHRADSSYRADSAAKRSAATLDYDRKQIDQYTQTIINWQQVVQQATQQKFAEVAKPTYDKVAASYKKVLAANKITLVLNPGAIEPGTDPNAVVNVFELVAKDLGIKLPTGDSGGGGQ